jgi:hypothetical protein
MQYNVETDTMWQGSNIRATETKIAVVGILGCKAVTNVDTNVSKERTASIFRAVLVSPHDVKTQKTDTDNFIAARTSNPKLAFTDK